MRISTYFSEFKERVFKAKDISYFYWAKIADRPSAPQPDLSFFSAIRQSGSPLKQLLLDHVEQQSILEDAERICGGELKLYGLEPSLFTAGIKWHCDFYSGHTWPLKPFNRIYDPNNSGIDLNVPFELSRLQFIPCLIQAYEITRESRFMKRLFEIVDSWIANNPFCFGVNWWSCLEVALRAANLALAIAWFFDRIDDRKRKVYLDVLWRHAVYIYRFDVVNDKVRNKNNHFLGSMAGLLIASLCFQGRDTENMRKTALNAINKEIPRQFMEDGVNFESATGYHQFSLEVVLTVILFLRSREVRLFEANVATEAFGAIGAIRIQRALDFVLHYMSSFGRSPQIGDSSDCRVLVFRDYFRRPPHDHAFLFAMGEAACRYRRRLPSDSICRGYHESGHAFFKNDVYGLVAFAGPKGSNGTGGHGHNDKGSFVLSFKGRPVLVDSGTYIYNSEIHNRFDLKKKPRPQRPCRGQRGTM